MLSATSVVWLTTLPVFVIPWGSITPPPDTLRPLICSPNERVLSGQGCQKVIGGLVWNGGKVPNSRTICFTEAPSFIPGLFRGMVFVAVTSVRKMSPSFRTSYIIVANFRIALIFIQCYLPSAILVVVEDVDVSSKNTTSKLRE